MNEENIITPSIMDDLELYIQEEEEKMLKSLPETILKQMEEVISSITFTPKYPNQKCSIFISELMLEYLKYAYPNPKMIGDKPTLFGYTLGVDKELGFSECYLKAYIAKE